MTHLILTEMPDEVRQILEALADAADLHDSGNGNVNVAILPLKLAFKARQILAGSPKHGR